MIRLHDMVANRYTGGRVRRVRMYRGIYARLGSAKTPIAGAKEITAMAASEAWQKRQITGAWYVRSAYRGSYSPGLRFSLIERCAPASEGKVRA